MLIPTRTFILASVISAAAADVCAQEKDPISTDRPDFLTAPDVVGKGRFQIETGALVQKNDADGARTRTLTTPTLLRFGVSDKVELRLETDGYVRAGETESAAQTTVHTRGYGDAAVGFKLNTHEGDDKGAPSIGWIFQAKLPTGSSAFRGKGVRPAVLGAFKREFPRDVALSVNAGLTYDNLEGEGRFFSATAGAGLSKGLTERLTLMAEVVAQQIARKRYGGNVAVFDVGTAYLLTDNLQVDALIGRGLTSESPKYLFTVGISARF